MTKIDEAVKILRDLGMPSAQQNERSGMTLLALLDVKKRTPWTKSKKRIIRIHDIMKFIEGNYGRKYAENTRETIRRQTLHQFEQAGIVARNPDDPSRPTNSPNNVYEVTDDALEAIKGYGTAAWSRGVTRFQDRRGMLVDIYDRKRHAAELRVDLPKGPSITLSPGKHNALQRDIIGKFHPRFTPGSSVLYIGDTARKMAHIDEGVLREIGFPMTRHDKLPDVVLFDRPKNTVTLVEAVT
ncbi:MAG TPA: BsuBI/PstI family type II restriction endonuclease, partial [Candidatus Bathyarchaeia archaeon]|nr:BsuBI/PstI family type II restriction endonuclease [Candidatus Bathyarchaeia archaeon]